MKLIRWVEEHLSGRSKRNKDDSRSREANHREATGLFYDQSLLPLHLKLDSSCRLLTNDNSGRTNRNHHNHHHHHHHLHNNHRYALGECEREERRPAVGHRPEPYDTIALATGDNGNWMVNNHPQVEASNPLRHSHFPRSGHLTASTLARGSLPSDIYSNDALYFTSGHMVNNAHSIAEREEEYLTVYFPADINSPSTDASTARSQIHSTLHTRSQLNQVNCNLNNSQIKHLSLLHAPNLQERPSRQDELYRDKNMPISRNMGNGSGYHTGNFTRHDNNRHSHQSYFTSIQINDDVDDTSPPLHSLHCTGSPFTPSSQRRYSERSRIKTNPWLKSPWTTPQKKSHQQCPSSSSVSGSNGNSSDSGCSLIPSNALVTTSESRTTVTCDTRVTTGDSLCIVSTPSSSLSSNNTSPTTDDDVNSSIVGTRCSMDKRASNSRFYGNDSGTLKDDVNENRFTTNITEGSDKILFNHRNSGPVYVSSPRKKNDGSSGSLSSNNNNGYICPSHGVRRRNKDQSVSGTLTSNCFPSQSTVFRASNGLTGNNASNTSSSAGRRRKRRSRIQSVGNCPVNNNSTLLTASSSPSNLPSVSSSPSDSSSKSSSPANDASLHPQHACNNALSSGRIIAASVKRRRSKVLQERNICPSTSSESLCQLPAPPDSVSSQLILQEILSDLATRAKTSSSSKQCTSSSSEGTPVEGKKMHSFERRPCSWTYSSGQRRRKQIDCNDIASIDDDNSQVNEKTTRQKASCIFSDVTLLPSSHRSNDTSSASNLSSSKERTHTAATPNGVSCYTSVESTNVTAPATAATTTTTATATVTGTSESHPPPRLREEGQKCGRPQQEHLDMKLLRSPDEADTLKATYARQSNESRNGLLDECDEKKTQDGSEGKSCTSENRPAGDIGRPLNLQSAVKLRRNVKSNIFNVNENRQSAPVFIDSENCKSVESPSPMAASMIVMGSTADGETTSASVYSSGSNDCFMMTPSSSRGSSVSFSRSSSVSSSRPGSFVSASAALSAAGRRYYSSLLNKRRFIPNCTDVMMNHPSQPGNCGNNSLFKRLSVMSNEEWVSTATEELICSDDEETESEIETSRRAPHSGYSSKQVINTRSCEVQSQPITRDVMKSIYNEDSNATGGKNFDSGQMNYKNNRERCDVGESVRPSVTSISMTHDTEMSQCGENKIHQDEEAQAIAAVTASAVSRRRKERRETDESSVDESKNRGAGSYIRPEVASTSFNCISWTSPTLSSPLCPVNNPAAAERQSDCLRDTDVGRKGESSSSSLVVSVSTKDDIHARGLFEARHLREMRKETKATLMQVNENIDCTFSPLQQLKLVSERLEHLLKMQDEHAGNTKDDVSLMNRASEKKEQRLSQMCNYPGDKGGNACVTVSQQLPDDSANDNGTFCMRKSPCIGECRVDDVVHSTHVPNEQMSRCDCKSPNLLHLSPLTPETPVTEDSGVQVTRSSSSTPFGGNSKTSVTADTFSSSCRVSSETLEGKASLDTNVKLTHVARSVGTTDSQFAPVTNVSSGSHFAPLSDQIKVTPPSRDAQVKASLTKRPISSSSTSQFDRRVRRTMEHEKLWQEISTRFSLNESNISSLLDSFIQTPPQGINAHCTSPSSPSSSPSSASSSSPPCQSSVK